jgi:hypothetical protein
MANALMNLTGTLPKSNHFNTKGGTTVSKRGSGSSARAGGGSNYSKTDYNEAKGAGFSTIESKQIAQAVKLVRETETYKNYAEQAERVLNNPNFAGAKNYTFEGLKKSWVATQAVEERISKAVVLHDIDAYPKPEFTSKQTTFARDIILKELGVDNPKWEKRRK